MKTKFLFQKALTKSIWLFKWYVKKHRLKEELLRALVYANREDLLLIYIKYHALSADIITEILQTEESKLMQEVLRRFVLNEAQSLILVEKNNALLLENYLCPDGYFLPARRFKKKVERQFVASMVKAEKMMGFEVFKTYVDNTSQDLIEPDILSFLVTEDTLVSRYVLKKCYLTKEQEEYLVENAKEKELANYLNEKQLFSDQAQLKLVERYPNLAKEYYERYGLRSKAQQVYHQMRKLSYEQNTGIAP